MNKYRNENEISELKTIILMKRQQDFRNALLNEATVITHPINLILFADDLSIRMITNNQLRAHQLLQNTIKAILLWLYQFGFHISPPKSKNIIFKKRKPKTPSPPLLLGSQPIPLSNTVKVLGLRFDASHSGYHKLKR